MQIRDVGKSQLFRRKLLRTCGAMAASAAAGLMGLGSTGGAKAARPIMPCERDGRLKWLAFYGQTANEAALDVGAK
jgi:hypothetical protein